MIFPFLRVLIGGILLVSGFNKIIYPYQNFLYVVQAYQLLPSWGETLIVVIVPWLEFLVGLFAVLGLWTPRVLKGVLVFFGIFIVVVGQALLRGLPLDHCGCFGSWIEAAPKQIIVFDSMCLLITVILLRYPSKTQRFSLDERF